MQDKGVQARKGLGVDAKDGRYHKVGNLVVAVRVMWFNTMGWEKRIATNGCDDVVRGEDSQHTVHGFSSIECTGVSGKDGLTRSKRILRSGMDG